MNILEQIIAERWGDVAEVKRAVPLEGLLERAQDRVHHSLVERMRSAGTRIVAEVKKASPSAGLLRPDYDPAAMAAMYEVAGAIGVSVLTEPRHFLGSGAHLEQVRQAVDLPVLRKDFMCDPYQVAEAAAWGADVVLLIVAALDQHTLHTLHAAARSFGLDVLAEAHDEREVDAALGLEDALVGVNSRNLKTLETDLATARALAGAIPAGRCSVAESGIRTRADVESLEALGYNGFLVGEAIVGAEDPAATLAALLGGAAAGRRSDDAG